jgi:hypothetical protein
MKKNTTPLTTDTTAATTEITTYVIDGKVKIEVLSDNISSFGLTDDEIKFRDELIDDLKLAETLITQSLYIYIRIGLKLVSIKNKLISKKGRYTKFLASIGFNERKAQRYMELATHNRYIQMSEDEIKSLHHIPQTRLIEMVKYDDETFYTAVNDSKYKFPKKQTAEEKEAALKKEYDELGFNNVSFENFEMYMKNTKIDLIKIIDTTISQYQNKVDIDMLDTSKLDTKFYSVNNSDASVAGAA